MHEQVGGKQGASSRELANLTVENYENPNKDDRQVAIDVGPSKLVSYTGATNLPAQGGWTGELNPYVAQMIAHYLKETWLDNDIGLHVHPGAGGREPYVSHRRHRPWRGEVGLSW